MGVRGLTSRISRRFVLILALAQLLLIYAWIVEPNWIEVTSHEAWFKNLPEEFNELLVAHLSDLHIRKYGARERRLRAPPGRATPALARGTAGRARGRRDGGARPGVLWGPAPADPR